MLHRLLLGVFTVASLSLAGCALSPQQLEPQPLLNGPLMAVGQGQPVSVKVVDGLDAAIDHINRYSSGHTEAIVSENYTRAMRFLREVDSASVMINASTRFADGFEYGLGAEIGISTDKIHARGPVGLEGLTSQKWIVFGDGQVRG